MQKVFKMQGKFNFPVVFFIVLELIHQSFGCFSTFKNAQNISFVQQDCTKSAGYPVIPTPEEMASDNFDDKCISKCILNGLQMIDNEGQIDKDILLDFMELNAPESYLMKLSELATSCTETSGSDKIEGGTKMGKSSHQCRPMQHFYSCFLLGAEKLC